MKEEEILDVVLAFILFLFFVVCFSMGMVIFTLVSTIFF